MSASSPFGLGPIGQIAVPVNDLDAAVAFYRDTLGLPFLFSAPPGLAFFDCAGVRLMLSLPENAEIARHSSVIYFKVDDIQAAYQALRERGAPVRRRAAYRCADGDLRPVDGLPARP